MNPFELLQAIEEEFGASRHALAQLTAGVESDPTILHRSTVRPEHIRRSLENVERTYFLRMFAEFEDILRRYWMWAKRRPRIQQTPIKAVIDRVASYQRVGTSLIDAVHEVRVYRNELLHARTVSLTLKYQECRSRICRFLSFLSYTWLYSRH